MFQLKGLAPNNKGHTNFEERCDLTKNYIVLTYVCKNEWTIYGHNTPVQKVLGVYFYRYRSNGIAKVDKQTSDHNNT